jgi:membrane protein
MKKINAILAIFKITAKSFLEHRGTQLSGTIAFFMLLSAFPLIILSTSIVKLILGNIPGFEARLIEITATVIPSMSAWIKNGIVGIAKNSYASQNLIGLLVLIWTSMQLFHTIEYAFKLITKYKPPVDRRKIIHQRLKSFSSTIVIGCVLTVIILLSIVPMDVVYRQLLENEIIIDSGLNKILLAVILESKFLPFLLALGLLTLSYKLIPPIKIRLKNAFIGAATFAILFVAAKYLYKIYVLFNIESLKSVYGVFTTSFIVILWFYYIAALFLYCGELIIILTNLEHRNEFEYTEGNINANTGRKDPPPASLARSKPAIPKFVKTVNK